MALFKKINALKELESGKKFIDTREHKIVLCENVYPIGNFATFVNVDDKEDSYILTFAEIKQFLRHFLLQDIEIRALLCSSMIEFISLMMADSEFLKGGKNNG